MNSDSRCEPVSEAGAGPQLNPGDNIMRLILCSALLAVILIPGSSRGQGAATRPEPADRAAADRKRAAELEAKLAELEGELAAVQEEIRLNRAQLALTRATPLTL